MTTLYKQTIQPLDLSRFETVNKTYPSSLVSNKYEFISTKSILETLSTFGWFPYSVKEARTRIEENKGFQKHSITLFNQKISDDLAVGTVIPQLVLVNSHSGSSSLQLHISFLEKICSNGLIVDTATYGAFRVTHRGESLNEWVSTAVQSAVSALPSMCEKVKRFQGINMNKDECLEFAEQAIEIRFDLEKYRIIAPEFLCAYRSAQREPNLWNVFNVVQEASIRGGVIQFFRDRKGFVRSRAIKSIDEYIRLNKSLWKLAETTAQKLQ
jgi:hypothetical protein